MDKALLDTDIFSEILKGIDQSHNDTYAMHCVKMTYI